MDVRKDRKPKNETTVRPCLRTGGRGDSVVAAVTRVTSGMVS